MMWIASRFSFHSHNPTFILADPVDFSMELLDFPPLWQLLDAHATWHMLTIPLGFLWYQCVLADSKGGWEKKAV
jgi:hypothetical protein